MDDGAGAIFPFLFLGELEVDMVLVGVAVVADDLALEPERSRERVGEGRLHRVVELGDGESRLVAGSGSRQGGLELFEELADARGETFPGILREPEAPRQ